MSQGEMALQESNLFNIKTGEQLVSVCEKPEINRIVQNFRQMHYSVDIEEIIHTLATVSDMLLLAYAGSKRFHCSTGVLELLSNYQDLMKDSERATRSFMNTSLTALKYHQIMEDLLERNVIDKTFTWIEKCTKLAGEMIVACDGLLKKSDDLVVLSKKVLLEANNTRADSEEEKKALQEKSRQEEIEQAKKEEHLRGVQSQLTQLTMEIKKQEDIESSNDNKHFWATFMPFMSRLERKYENNALKAHDAAREAKKLKLELIKQQSEINAEVAAIICKLKSHHGNKDEINKAVTSLELSIKSLGRVKNAFHIMKKFWQEVQCHSKSLKDFEGMKELAESETKDLFSTAIKESGCNWLLLGKINYCSDKGLKTVSEKVDWAMSHLPQDNEVDGLIKNLAKCVMDDIQKSDLKITESRTNLEE